MAGYSGTPLPKKLGIVEGAHVAVINGPAAFDKTLGPLPARVTISRSAVARSDVIVLFVSERAQLANAFGRLAAALKKNGGLWVAWPKKASGVASDLDENVVRAVGLEHGLVDNKVCAIDETWSGLRFVYRRVDREARHV